MTKGELKVFWVGIAIITLMGLFPPWSSVYKVPKLGLEKKTFEGYSFITKKPELFSKDVVEELKESKDRSRALDLVMRSSSLRIDFARLIIQWVLIITIIGGVIVSLKSLRKEEKVEKGRKENIDSESLHKRQNDDSDSQLH